MNMHLTFPKPPTQYTEKEVLEYKDLKIGNTEKIAKLFYFGHNFGPILQEGFRSVNEDEFFLFKEEYFKSKASDRAWIFISKVDNGNIVYYVFNKGPNSFKKFDPNASMREVFKHEKSGEVSVFLDSSLPFWHNYVCCYPQVKI